MSQKIIYFHQIEMHLSIVSTTVGEEFCIESLEIRNSTGK